MRTDDTLAALLLAAMAGSVNDHMRPPADIRDQLAAAVTQHGNIRPFAVGDLVFAKELSEWKRHPGLPNVVLALRPDAPPDYTSKEATKRGNALDLRIGFWTPHVGVVPMWASACDFELYDEAKHGARDKQSRERTEAPAAA